MKVSYRINLVIAVGFLILSGQGRSQPLPAEKSGAVTVLVLLGEWFGDAYFPLKDEIAARGWTMKRVGVDVEYRGCYNKKRDVVPPLLAQSDPRDHFDSARVAWP